MSSDNAVLPPAKMSRLDARIAWVTNELVACKIDSAHITLVQRALRLLKMAPQPLSVGTLTTRLSRLAETQDSQQLDAVAELAEDACHCVEQFEILWRVENTGFFKNARLPESLLDENNLDDYIQAAKLGKDSAKSRLDFLMEQQEPGGNNEPNVYICILASSGTGKTQLAATASLTYKQATTIYLNMGTGGDQAFYRPHDSFGSKQLKKEIATFMNKLGGEGVSANQISNWAASSDDEGCLAFVRILYHLLTGKPFVPLAGEKFKTRMTLKSLKKRIKHKKYLVFLDEVPPKGHDDYRLVLCLRDILRSLGIAPILMSTHTGAQDYIGNTPRVTIDVWAWVVSSLPKFEPFPADSSNILVENERPMVLRFARRRLAEGQTSLREIIHNLQRYLQERKNEAWTASPALQLVQLFPTDVDVNGESFASAHKLVGHHFGTLLQGQSNGRKKYNCVEARNFANDLSVAPVSAAKEPLLYLALVTWDESMLREGDEENRDEVAFPLSDSKKRALTVRSAFTACRNDFTSNASTANPKADKADGALLEVLVHASLTLASMKVTPGDQAFLGGVHLKNFIPLVRALMLDGYLGKLPPVPEIFDNLLFKWPTVPALSGSESGLPGKLGKACGSCLGYLERPADKAMVDGLISYVRGEAEEKNSAWPFIGIECKNYAQGVKDAILKEVFKRVKSGIKCNLIFVSSIQPAQFVKTSLESVKTECFAERFDPDSVSVMVWHIGDAEPTFLIIKGEPFKAKKEISLLIVIISVGYIDASISRKKRRLAQNCANC